MSPVNVGKLGSRTQLTWAGWVLELSESWDMGFVVLKTNPANPAKTWLFVLINLDKLREVGSKTQLTWVTCSLV